MFENIILGLVIIGFIYFFYIRPGQKNKAKKALKSETVQELLDYKEITPDGLIVLDDNRYRRIFEIIPTNIKIKSISEQASIWEEERNACDNVSIDRSKVIQTRIIQMRDYLAAMKSDIDDIKGKYPDGLYNYGNTLVDELKIEYEDKQKRVRKFFIILKVDGNSIADMESSFTVDNAALGALFSSNKKNKYTNEELRNISISELDNAYEQILNSYFRSGIGIIPLDKVGVLDYLNNTISRDIANVYRIDLMNKANITHLVPKSATIDLFFTKLELENILRHEEEAAASSNLEFSYEGDDIVNDTAK